MNRLESFEFGGNRSTRMPLPLYRHRAHAPAAQCKKALIVAGLLLVAFLYGAMFALFPPSFIPPMLLPLLLLAMLVIWALPGARRAPTRTLYWLYTAFFVALVIWPNYLAVAVPGLPWITLIRIFGIPLGIVLLICLSISREFREQITAVIQSAPLVWKLLVGFVCIQLLSIFFSAKPFQSLEKFVVAQIYWTSIFFVSCYLFRKPGRVTLWAMLLVAMMVFVCALGVWEWRISRVAWAGHIPSFLKIEDESVLRILAGAARATTGIYRVQGTATTSVGFAELLALTTPFAIHLFMSAKRIYVRAAALAVIPFIFFTIVNTDSRSGALGFFLGSLLYVGFWAVRRWRLNSSSILGPAISLAYPLILGAFFIASMFIGRLHRMVWGGGEHQPSTEARLTQLDRGLPMVFQRPLGHGVGQGAEALGYTNGEGVLTIDTYYLSIALEYGLLGFVVYYGMFAAGIGYGGRALTNSGADEVDYCIPLVSSLLVFMVIKSVFSQEANHPLVFMMLGMICALAWRAKTKDQTA